jgi:hypothetical protein
MFLGKREAHGGIALNNHSDRRRIELSVLNNSTSRTIEQASPWIPGEAEFDFDPVSGNATDEAGPSAPLSAESSGD